MKNHLIIRYNFFSEFCFRDHPQLYFQGFLIVTVIRGFCVDKTVSNFRADENFVITQQRRKLKFNDLGQGVVVLFCELQKTSTVSGVIIFFPHSCLSLIPDDGSHWNKPKSLPFGVAIFSFSCLFSFRLFSFRLFSFLQPSSLALKLPLLLFLQLLFLLKMLCMPGMTL